MATITIWVEAEKALIAAKVDREDWSRYANEAILEEIEREQKEGA